MIRRFHPLLAPLAPLALLVAQPASVAQECGTAIDVVTDPAAKWSSPGGGEGEAPVELGGRLLFRAHTQASGMELFTTDGTAGGTALVADLQPGFVGSYPRDLVRAGGFVFFLAQTLDHGLELWRTDGSAGGTLRLTDLGPGSDDGGITDLIAVGPSVFFIGSDPVHGQEVWTSDGTLAGTQLLVDALPGPGDFSPEGLAADANGSYLVTSASVPGSGREPTAIDLTTGAVTLLADALIGGGSSSPTDFRTFGSQVVFVASGAGGPEPWITDGTALGTFQLADLYAGPFGAEPEIANGVEFNGHFYFPSIAFETGVLNPGLEVWRTDGTVAGTELAFEVSSSWQDSNPSDLVVWQGELYFAAQEVQGAWNELWATQGDQATLRLVADIKQGGASFPRQLTPGGSLLYFTADDGSDAPFSDHDLWATDGTAAGTRKLFDSTIYEPTSIAPLPGGGAVFAGSTDELGVELGTTDGTMAGTGLIDIEPAQTNGSSNPRDLQAVLGRELFWWAYGDEVTTGLHRWSAADGFGMVGGLSAEVPFQAFLETLWLGDEEVRFLATHYAGHERFTWTLDENHNAVPLVDGSFQEAARLGDRAVLDIDDELWISDGTTAGTTQIVQLGLFDSSEISGLTSLGDRVVFAATDADREVWVTNGTAQGTKQLADIWPGDSYLDNSDPHGFVRVGDQVAFLAEELWIYDPELWATDGTIGGTYRVMPQDALPEISGTGYHATGEGDHLVEAGGLVYFLAKREALFGTYDLWRSDLTPEGTFVVASPEGTLSPSFCQLEAASDGRLFFTAQRGGWQPDGSELWVSDGTVAGTRIVHDFSPMEVTELEPLGDGMAFALSFSEHGQPAQTHGVYRTDGSPGHFELLCETPPFALISLPGYSYPDGLHPADATQLTVVDGELFFVRNGPLGTEVHRVPNAGPQLIDLDLAESNTAIHATSPELGSLLTVTGSGFPLTSVSVLLLGLPLDGPAFNATAYGQAAWLDPATATLLTVPIGSHWTWSAPLPADPVLTGLGVTLQAWTAGPTVVPATTSNGLLLVLGD